MHVFPATLNLPATPNLAACAPLMLQLCVSKNGDVSLSVISRTSLRNTDVMKAVSTFEFCLRR